MTDLQRIAKFLSRAGVCSRRDAEKLIEQGRVKVNGEIIETPAIKVVGDEDIRVDDKKIAKADKARIWLFHKPEGCLTTSRDDRNRKTIFDYLPKDFPRVMTIGRLDYNTEGLLLLTNDGQLARDLELPENNWVREYKVRAYGILDQARMAEVKKGVVIDGVKYLPAQIESHSDRGHNKWFSVKIKEGKNREVRKLFSYMNMEVNRLIRVAYGPFYLGSLAKSAIKEVPAKIIDEQIGSK